MSRVTNDIDNVTTTLQQGMSQLLNSGLTIIGVIAIMFWISPLLAVISLITVPIVDRRDLAHRPSLPGAVHAQWARTGTLNGHVEEMHTGHALVQVFGQSDAAIEKFEQENEPLYQASFRAQFLSGVIQPAMQFLANLNYVAIAVIGGYRVASGALSLGDVQAFIQYSRQFTMPITQIASQMNLLQSGRGLGRAGLRTSSTPKRRSPTVEPSARARATRTGRGRARARELPLRPRASR